jgi:hypothetical protein
MAVSGEQLEARLDEAELIEEMELTTGVIVAATASAAPLSQDQIDELLGLTSP